MGAEAQRRLNRFKLFFLEPDGDVSLAGKSILEFGCGHARLAIETRNLGWRSYDGIDFCAELVDIGRRRLADAGLAERARLVCCECLDYDGPQKRFDVVCSLGMFEFVEDPEPPVRKMVSHLAPGGTLFLDVHHDSWLLRPLRSARWKRAEGQGGVPKRAFRADEMCKLLTDAGLVDVRILMVEYPWLGELYARTGLEPIRALRDRLARWRTFDAFATDFVAIANAPGDDVEHTAGGLSPAQRPK